MVIDLFNKSAEEITTISFDQLMGDRTDLKDESSVLLKKIFQVQN